MSSRNRHAQELCEQTATYDKTQTDMQDSATENCSQNTLMMWELGNSLTIKCLPKIPQNKWLYAAAATKKKDSSKIRQMLNDLKILLEADTTANLQQIFV